MDINVIDNLTSTDKYAALSANQGRVLRGMIENTATEAEIDLIFV